MADATADATVSPTAESTLNSDVEALFMEINSASQKGMLIWTLQKKVEVDPSCSISLISVLVSELDKKVKSVSKINKNRPYMSIIPLLHTLYYVVIQSGVMIPDRLYQRVYKCLTKLLILPLPHSAVAQRTLRSIKMEMITPGSLYQRRVIAEQNLKNEHFTLQERVFVLADPAVFSASLEATLRAYLEVSGLLRNKHNMERKVVLHVLQTGLEMECQRTKLAQALEVLEDHVVNKYFQELVLAMKQSINSGAGGHADYMSTLQEIYSDIMASEEVPSETNDVGRGALHSTTLPYPEINFLLWNDEEDLWNLLTKFTLQSRDEDKDEKDKRDSGIERDLKDSDLKDTREFHVRHSALRRRKAYKSTHSTEKLSLVQEKIDKDFGSSPVVKEEHRHTARVVVMGDNRVLGRLARAYHSIRNKESKHNMLTKKLNLQLYYIPVTGVERSFHSPNDPFQEEDRLSLASYLGKMDPWYNSNINSLGAAIPDLPEMPSNPREPSELNLFLLDTLCYYLRCGTQPTNLPLYSVKMTRTTSGVVEEVFVSHLEADIPEFRHLKEKLPKEVSVRQRRSTTNTFGAVVSVSYTKASLSKRAIVKGDAPITCGLVITSEMSTSGEDYLAVSFDGDNPQSNTKIQTKRISIKTVEKWAFCVCLDKDSRRTYTNVQRIDIFPCLDPGCNILSKFSISNDRELPLSKYLDKVLSLPINTFTGVTI